MNDLARKPSGDVWEDAQGSVPMNSRFAAGGVSRQEEQVHLPPGGRRQRCPRVWHHALWSQSMFPEKPFWGALERTAARTWVREWGSGGPCALGEETVPGGKERGEALIPAVPGAIQK